MTKKTDLLVRDIAKLIATYRMDTWAPVLAQLRLGSVIHKDIAEALENLLSSSRGSTRNLAKRASRKPLKKYAPDKGYSEPYTVSMARHDLLQPLRTALLNKTLLPSLGHVREAYQLLGLKKVPPSPRLRAIDEILRHLDNISEERLHKSIDIVLSIRASAADTQEGDYKRWFDVITKEPTTS